MPSSCLVASVALFCSTFVCLWTMQEPEHCGQKRRHDSQSPAQTNMKTSLAVLVWAAAANASVYRLSASAPASVGAPLLDAFVSYSIEFASFPDFAGNKSAPSKFSDALLSNLGHLTGTKPYIRVG